MREINAEQKIAKLARDEELTREESTMKISVLWLNKLAFRWFRFMCDYHYKKKITNDLVIYKL